MRRETWGRHPQTLVLTPGGGEVTASWGQVAGATSYTLYLASRGGVSPATLASLPDSRRIEGLAGPTTTITGMPYGVTLLAVVTATVEGSEGALSPEVAALMAPAAPAQVQAIPLPGSVALYWTSCAYARATPSTWRPPRE